MICYHDMTFCSYWESCIDDKDFFRALNDRVFEQAALWWDDRESAPICQFSNKPEYFKELINHV